MCLVHAMTGHSTVLCNNSTQPMYVHVCGEIKYGVILGRKVTYWNSGISAKFERFFMLGYMFEKSRPQMQTSAEQNKIERKKSFLIHIPNPHSSYMCRSTKIHLTSVCWLHFSCYLAEYWEMFSNHEPKTVPRQVSTLP